MSENKLRRRIAIEAAQLLLQRKESGLARARMRAARAVCRGFVPRDQFPSEAEIRDEIEKHSYVRKGDARFDNLREVRLAALDLMRSLDEFEPRVTGNLLREDLRTSGAIELIFDIRHRASVTALLYELNSEENSVGNCRADRDDRTSIVVDFVNEVSLQGVTLSEFEEFLEHTYPDLDLNADEDCPAPQWDRFQVYRMLLAPLEQVQQRKATHPEGDVLYHSLQVFELACSEIPYDEEFLLAALLHDVGKGIDPMNPVQAGLQALQGYITERTEWLIENLPDAQKLVENSLGARARRRLQQHPDYEELMLLARCDRAGRVSGGQAPELEEALETLRDLARTCG